MKRTTLLRTVRVSMLAAAIGLASGCATWDRMSSADKGTAAGAVVGGAVGNVVTDGALGTIGGAVIGGAVGREVGKKRD